MNKIIRIGTRDSELALWQANTVSKQLNKLGYKTEILHFDSNLEGVEFEQQAAYQFWHLLYSAEDDSSAMGNEKLVNKITQLFGFEKEYAKNGKLKNGLLHFLAKVHLNEICFSY